MAEMGLPAPEERPLDGDQNSGPDQLADSEKKETVKEGREQEKVKETSQDDQEEKK